MLRDTFLSPTLQFETVSECFLYNRLWAFSLFFSPPLTWVEWATNLFALHPCVFPRWQLPFRFCAGPICKDASLFHRNGYRTQVSPGRWSQLAVQEKTQLTKMSVKGFSKI